MYVDEDSCGFVSLMNMDITETAALASMIRGAGLRETTGGRFEKNDIQLLRTDVPGGGSVQIEVKHGLDYAARISFVIVEKALTQRVIGGDIVKQCRLDPNGSMVYSEKEE